MKSPVTARFWLGRMPITWLACFALAWGKNSISPREAKSGVDVLPPFRPIELNSNWASRFPSLRMFR